MVQEDDGTSPPSKGVLTTSIARIAEGLAEGLKTLQLATSSRLSRRFRRNSLPNNNCNECNLRRTASHKNLPHLHQAHPHLSVKSNRSLPFSFAPKPKLSRCSSLHLMPHLCGKRRRSSGASGASGSSGSLRQACIGQRCANTNSGRRKRLSNLASSAGEHKAVRCGSFPLCKEAKDERRKKLCRCPADHHLNNPLSFYRLRALLTHEQDQDQPLLQAASPRISALAEIPRSRSSPNIGEPDLFSKDRSISNVSFKGVGRQGRRVSTSCFTLVYGDQAESKPVSKLVISREQSRERVTSSDDTCSTNYSMHASAHALVLETPDSTDIPVTATIARASEGIPLVVTNSPPVPLATLGQPNIFGLGFEENSRTVNDTSSDCTSGYMSSSNFTVTEGQNGWVGRSRSSFVTFAEHDDEENVELISEHQYALVSDQLTMMSERVNLLSDQDDIMSSDESDVDESFIRIDE